MKYATVILDIATQSLNDAFSYAVPEGMADIDVGCAVQVPFGRRQAIGFVVDIIDAQDSYELPFDASRMREIEAAVTRPYFNRLGAQCALFMSKRYLAPLSSCVRLFTPPGGVPKMVKSGKGWTVRQPVVGEVDDRWVTLGDQAASFKPKKNAVKQQAILKALESGDLRVSELVAEYGQVSSSIKALERAGAVRVELRRRMRGDAQCVPSGSSEYGSVAFEPTEKHTLTEGQGKAIDEIRTARAARDGRVVVIDGVTGSGKTEVYLQAIEDVLLEGMTAVVLVPEISLTPQTVARFRGRFGDLVAVMHSRMSQGERYDQWDFIRSGQARVVVGARSALFTPLENVGLIVIDEEHEDSYKQDSAPRYVSRDVAEWMVKQTGAALVLGSATPCIESLHRVDTQSDWSIVSLPERANGRPMPEICVVDMAHEFGAGQRSMFSRELQMRLEEALRANHKAVMLLNQRGFAQFVLCRDCGYVPECPSCSNSLTFHEHGNRLICHHCGYSMQTPPLCPQCQSPYLKKFGAGTQRVEAELSKLIDEMHKVEAQVIRMDADTTKTKGAHQRLLEQFAAPGAAVLLGTQMIAKGLDFDDVTLVGVINADTQLRLPDFRAAERTFNLIEQVAGRAGRAHLPGRVIVQTYNASSVPIQAAAHYDRAYFLNDELPKRKILKYPPYASLADILIWGANEARVRQCADDLFVRIADRVVEVPGEPWVVLPATPCVLTRLRGNFRYHITIKAPKDADIAGALADVFRKRKPDEDVRVSVDIDPVSLL